MGVISLQIDPQGLEGDRAACQGVWKESTGGALRRVHLSVDHRLPQTQRHAAGSEEGAGRPASRLRFHVGVPRPWKCCVRDHAGREGLGSQRTAWTLFCNFKGGPNAIF